MIILLAVEFREFDEWFCGEISLKFLNYTQIEEWNAACCMSLAEDIVTRVFRPTLFKVVLRSGEGGGV